jgi:hypothetical protein
MTDLNESEVLRRYEDAFVNLIKTTLAPEGKEQLFDVQVEFHSGWIDIGPLGIGKLDRRYLDLIDRVEARLKRGA